MNIKAYENSITIRTDAVKRFLSDIQKTKVITSAEEKSLFSKYEDSVNRVNEVKASNMPAATAANIIAKEEKLQNEIRNEIILRNQRFNFAVAKRFNNGDILMDLVNVGTIGMYEAFQKYDYKEGVRFCSFAVWYIRRAINAYLVKENLSVRTTNNTRIMPKVKKIENDFFLKNGRKPSGVEVMDILMDKYGIEVAVESDIYGTRMESIDAYFGDETDNTFDKSEEYNNATASYNDYENEVENESLSLSMRRAMKVLSERERTIICMANGIGYNKDYKDKEIGEELGLTSERVRQLRNSAQTKLAAALSVARK
jgi:RNA polymerase sigma factor (sigma-70 family)